MNFSETIRGVAKRFKDQWSDQELADIEATALRSIELLAQKALGNDVDRDLLQIEAQGKNIIAGATVSSNRIVAEAIQEWIGGFLRKLVA